MYEIKAQALEKEQAHVNETMNLSNPISASHSVQKMPFIDCGI